MTRQSLCRSSFLRALTVSMVVAAVGLLWPAAAFGAVGASGWLDHDSSSIMTVYDSNGRVLSKLCHGVTPGDYLITQDNRGWVVSRVEGKKAYAKDDGEVDLLKATRPRANLGSAITSIWGRLTSAVGGAKDPPVIGLYCSHSDEAYVPTAGRASEDKGGIYNVAGVLKRVLESKGYKVVQSQNNHNPHDAAAYTRSRRTVAELMKYRPVALVDVHRDAIPDASFYQADIKGRDIAATRIVVGKQNASSAVNLDFAKRIKAEADKAYPGLVKEIFWGRGNYNQDTGPNTILVEFGTHTNSEELANAGAELMGAVLPVAISGQATAAGGAGRGAWTSLLWVLGIAAVVGIGFVALNKGGVEFFKKGRGTTANFLGRLAKPRSRTRRRRRRR